MGRNNIEAIDKNLFHGWYYDFQEEHENKFQSMSLHPNKKLERGEDGKISWTNFSPSECWDSEVATRGLITPEKQDANANINKVLYCKKPIASSIFHEDFNVGVVNNWTEFGGNPIGQLWDSYKSLGPWAGAVRDAVGRIAEQAAAKYTKDGDDEHKIGKIIREGTAALRDLAGTGDDYLSKGIIVQGSNYSYFSSTGIAFGSMNLHFFVFPKFKYGKIVRVSEQLEDMYPYLVGMYEQANEVDIMIEKRKNLIVDLIRVINPDSGLADTLSNVEPAKLAEYIGWQLPPGGYKSSLKSVDTINEGTLMLRIGPMYAVTNLVCESATFNFSKQMVKLPEGYRCLAAGDPVRDVNINLEPLYCEVSITLRPASKYTSASLVKFTNGRFVLDKEFMKEINSKI